MNVRLQGARKVPSKVPQLGRASITQTI